MSLLNIQMLSRPLHQQIFGGRESSVKRSAIDRCRKHLKSQDLWGKKGSTLPDLDIELPRLTGDNIDTHFRNIAEMQSRPYLDLAVELMRTPLPPMPKEWSFAPGWTKYDPNTGESASVDYPEDSGLVFDVEVCTMESPRPILATAASQRHWYSWVSKRLTSSEDFYANMHRRTVLGDLIPFETADGGGIESAASKNHRLIVGHNVSFDRARIREQYYIKVRGGSEKNISEREKEQK
jgi:DNA polymerase gamma 1